MDDAETTERIEGLEARIAFLERTIDELNEALTAQWRQLDALGRQVVRLEDQLRETQAALPDRNAPESPPPHY